MTRRKSRTSRIPARTRRSRGRRGTVLLFALGVLAIISVAALSYVTFVRVDRNSSAAVAKTVLYERQVGRVIAHHQDVLAADLFGNKLVTPAVPRDFVVGGSPNQPPIWPKMFEDGEYRDYSWTNFATFNRDLPGKKAKGVVDNSVLRLDEVAPQDDAWLSSIDPVWVNPQNGGRTHWRQITNVRGIYTYDDAGTPKNLTDDRWIRGDGKFVDLGQFFLDYRTIGSTHRGNPATNLLDKTIFGNGSPNGAVFPRFAAGDYTLAPFEALHFMDTYPAAPSAGNPQLTPRDERFWADTDGDLRPDARWQLIDSLGTAEGLIWVTASRIVDLSGMVNANSSIEGGFGATSLEEYAEGRTPADIDLFRLLRNDLSGENIIPFGRQWVNVRSDSTKLTQDGGTFAAHLVDRLRVKELMLILDDPDPRGTDPVDFPFQANWEWSETQLGGRMTSDQRRAYWNEIGSAPGRVAGLSTPRGPAQIGYSLDNMLDLHAFSGTNNRSILSEFEEVIDGPDNTLGFLPRPEDDDTVALGPMRSRERPGDARYLGSALTAAPGPNQTRPHPIELRNDPRRLLTMVSGASNVSPVPVLNNKAQVWNGRPYYGRFFNERVRLSDFGITSVPAAYEAFVWALAPLATDEPITAWCHKSFGALVGDFIDGRRLVQTGGATNPAYHYGGEDVAGGPSPARDLAPAARPSSVQYGGASGASFATHTSVALALNLKDASDSDSNPTVGRLFVSDRDEDALRTHVLGQDKVAFGTRFSHGDIPQDLLPADSSGLRATDTATFDRVVEQKDAAGIDAWLSGFGKGRETGVTFVGLEKHPYITEVFAFALFETAPEGSLIDTYDANRQVGSVIVFQVQNPYQSEVTIDSSYEFVLMRADKSDLQETGSEAPLRLSPTESVRIAANNAATFVFTYGRVGDSNFFDVLGIGPDDDADDEIDDNDSVEDKIRDESFVVRNKRLALHADSQQLVLDYPAFVMKFARQPVRVVLRRDIAALATPGVPNTSRAVLDYFETAQNFCDFPAAINMADASLGFTAAYFSAVGYTAMGDLLDPDRQSFDAGRIAGRVGLTCSVTRPVRASTNGDFPKYVVATRGDDINVDSMSDGLRSEWFMHAWLYPIQPVNPGHAPNVIPGLGLPPRLHFMDAPIAGFPVVSAELINQHDLESSTLKTADSKAGGVPDRTPGFFSPNAPGWQLWVPDVPLEYVSELHQLCTYAHMCRDDRINDIGAWTTVGMQLRESLTWDYAKASNFNNNPYLATLDPTRYIPSGPDFFGDGEYTRDDSLALPLALRVFDCFEALEPADALAQGRININTATERVLQVLPLMAPGDSLLSPLGQDDDRVLKMLQFRDAWDPDSGNVWQPDYLSQTMLSLGSALGDFSKGEKIRRHDSTHRPADTGINTQYPFTTGFATAGELAYLNSWGDASEPQDSFPAGFVPSTLALDGSDIGGTDEARRVFEGNLGVVVDPGAPTFTFTPDGIADDPKERLALYRAVSNIVTTRSDVFGAWFVLRGYDPKQIEAIDVDPGDPLAAMDNAETPFLPVYESRWFVIYDRSNCKSPTDRPRVLLKAQLPSAKP